MYKFYMSPIGQKGLIMKTYLKRAIDLTKRLFVKIHVVTKRILNLYVQAMRRALVKQH